MHLETILQGGATAAVTRLAEAVPRPDPASVMAAGSSGPARPQRRWVDLGAQPDCSTYKNKKIKKHSSGSVGDSAANLGPKRALFCEVNH